MKVEVYLHPAGITFLDISRAVISTESICARDPVPEIWVWAESTLGSLREVYFTTTFEFEEDDEGLYPHREPFLAYPRDPHPARVVVGEAETAFAVENTPSCPSTIYEIFTLPPEILRSFVFAS